MACLTIYNDLARKRFGASRRFTERYHLTVHSCTVSYTRTHDHYSSALHVADESAFQRESGEKATNRAYSKQTMLLETALILGGVHQACLFSRDFTAIGRQT